MIDNQLFAKRLKRARTRKAQKLGFKTARGYSQEQLGIDAGIDEGSASARINQYEHGKHLPDLGMAARLASALEVPLAYLFCAEDDIAELLLVVGRLAVKKRRELIKLAEAFHANKGV